MKGYKTVGREAHIEIVIQKSRFLGHCYPVESEREALQILEALRKQYWDASHNCYAYSIGETGAVARYSDDGEPGGTAGLPMIEVFKKRQLTNLLVVVTRYFGGVLLGAGGLLRAYSKSASEAVTAAGEVSMLPCRRLTLTVEYPKWQTMELFLKERTLVEQVAFTDKVTAAVLIPEEDVTSFVAAVTERTDGRITPETGESLIYPFPFQTYKQL